MSHAILSPSAATRWLACTPSARFEANFPDTAGEAAAEGTLAHLLGETMLKLSLDIINAIQYKQRFKHIKTNKLYQPVMENYMEDYQTFVMERYNEAKSHTPDAKIFLEERLDMTKYVPEGFGTGDVVIIANTVMDIIDLKYGKGVAVSAIDNKQMMMYALGALQKFDFLYNIGLVRMTIYQPRLDNISTFEMSVHELFRWAIDELKPRAMMAFNGEGEFKAGTHCRWCKAKGICRTNAEYNLALEKYDFDSPDKITPAEISDILSKADGFLKWLAAVQEYALDQAVNHRKKFPGYKLVEGRSNRQIIDENQTAERLLEKGFRDDQIYNKSLLGVTALEKLAGKPFIAQEVVKPPGKPTLVPEADKRPELNSLDSARSDFANVKF